MKAQAKKRLLYVCAVIALIVLGLLSGEFQSLNPFGKH